MQVYGDVVVPDEENYFQLIRLDIFLLYSETGRAKVTIGCVVCQFFGNRRSERGTSVSMTCDTFSPGLEKRAHPRL